MIAEQLGSTVRWHHRDPLNLVARDTEPGQVTRKVHAVTPNGAQIETSEGVNLTQYYACLLGGNNNPTCTGYNPQAAAAYGYLANQANGMLAAGLKVDGALTLKSLSDIAQQIGRTGYGSIIISHSLFGTPMGAAIGVTAGSWQKRQVWTDIETGDPTQITARDDSYYEWVPGGVGIGTDIGLTGWQQKNNQSQPRDSQPQNQSSLSAYDCENIRKILLREKTFGTALAATASSVLLGDGAAANPVRGGQYNTRHGVLDLEWFSLLSSYPVRSTQVFQSMSNPLSFSFNGVGSYIGGKLLWTLSRTLSHLAGYGEELKVSNALPFTDPGERTALKLSLKFTSYKDIFDDDFMKQNCPPSMVGPEIK